ncbi:MULTISPECIES: NADH-quinone oxidoreductase subunit C [unclassified Streptomyces]|uniref:NADH-quinone oxidoreductase subunit C n=1 Tax=unclassified Streptomyces TaxID=2593676 RepID=UPI00344F3398
MSERQPPPHHPYDRLPDAVTEIFGKGATAESAYDLLTVDVPATDWITALRTARDDLGCRYFDWLSAVDEPGTGFRVCAHVAAVGDGSVRRLMLRTTVPHDTAVLPSAIDVYAGAAWHERETHEMFGVAFKGHPGLAPLLLPEGFEGHPLRKDFVLAARVAKAWPGAKEPGESEHGGPKRRTMLPPGVPDPNEWGPLKGQLPPAAARPTRAARPAADRPPRRARSASEGSAAQRPQTGPAAPSAPEVSRPGTPAPEASRPGTPAPETSRSETPEPETYAPDTPRPETSAPEIPGPEDSAPAAPDTATPKPVQPPSATAPPSDASPDDVPTGPPPAARPRRSRSASDGSASQQQSPEAAAPRPPRRSRSASQGSASGRARSTDAPWHDARPAFDDPDTSPRGPDTPPKGPDTPPTGPDTSPRGADTPPKGPDTSPDDPDAPTPSRQPSEGGDPDKPDPTRDKPDPDTPHPAGGDTE